jgi:hypothetical protein
VAPMDAHRSLSNVLRALRDIPERLCRRHATIELGRACSNELEGHAWLMIDRMPLLAKMCSIEGHACSID